MKIKIKNKNTMTIFLKVKDKKLFKNYNKIWKKNEESMRIKVNTKPTDGDDEKYIKTKIKSYGNNITTNFYHKKRS